MEHAHENLALTKDNENAEAGDHRGACGILVV